MEEHLFLEITKVGAAKYVKEPARLVFCHAGEFIRVLEELVVGCLEFLGIEDLC